MRQSCTFVYTKEYDKEILLHSVEIREEAKSHRQMRQAKEKYKLNETQHERNKKHTKI